MKLDLKEKNKADTEEKGNTQSFYKEKMKSKGMDHSEIYLKSMCINKHINYQIVTKLKNNRKHYHNYIKVNNI